ncbi:hypothetical protein os4_36780 (plasmid) [Comamonadaceae bacterium OS-4]|nr:hypothetical protein os4_36780 [Comamonadaceae bacterium OS-4]
MNTSTAQGQDRSKTFEVIESKRWVSKDGRTASIYGALPYTSEAESSQWEIRVVGFTVRNINTGTVGIGRQPWETYEQADDWLNGRTA